MMPKIVYWQFIYFEFAVIIEICKCIFFNIVSSYFFHFFCVNFVVHLNDGESQIDQSTSPSLFNSNLKTCCIKVAECSIELSDTSKLSFFEASNVSLMSV